MIGWVDVGGSGTAVLCVWAQGSRVSCPKYLPGSAGGLLAAAGGSDSVTARDVHPMSTVDRLVLAHTPQAAHLSYPAPSAVNRDAS